MLKGIARKWNLICWCREHWEPNTGLSTATATAAAASAATVFQHLISLEYRNQIEALGKLFLFFLLFFLLYFSGVDDKKTLQSTTIDAKILAGWQEVAKPTWKYDVNTGCTHGNRTVSQAQKLIKYISNQESTSLFATRTNTHIHCICILPDSWKSCRAQRQFVWIVAEVWAQCACISQ